MDETAEFCRMLAADLKPHLGEQVVGLGMGRLDHADDDGVAEAGRGLGVPEDDGLRGRRVTAYPALELDMQTAGATFQDTETVVDGTLVSARAWPDHPTWMREFLTVLRSKAPAT